MSSTHKRASSSFAARFGVADIDVAFAISVIKRTFVMEPSESHLLIRCIQEYKEYKRQVPLLEMDQVKTALAVRTDDEWVECLRIRRNCFGMRCIILGRIPQHCIKSIV